MAYADLALECERLARDFGRLALADVSGAIVTERQLTWCRRPIVRVKDFERLRARITPKPTGMIVGWANGCELSDVAPQTADEFLSAPVWYSPINCDPIVNSVGQSLVMESGWETIHEWDLAGANASHAFALLERAGDWTLKRWGWLSKLLWPGRGTVGGKSCWPDVVNQVSELSRDATLPRPEWAVNVGPNNARWPVTMWKRRDEWALGGPRFTAEDVERIGEDPEVVLSTREHWLADSEAALEWLAKQFMKEQTVAPAIVQTNTPVQASEPKYELFPEERTIRIGYWQFDRLTPKMVKILSVFVEQYEKGFPIVDLEMIRNRTKYRFDGGFLRQAFKQKRSGQPPMHPVASLMVQVSDGNYRLMDPTEIKNKVPE